VICLLGCGAAGLVVVGTRGVYEQLAAHLSELQQEEAQDMMQQVGGAEVGRGLWGNSFE
jgi:hypothetical protein